MGIIPAAEVGCQVIGQKAAEKRGRGWALTTFLGEAWGKRIVKYLATAKHQAVMGLSSESKAYMKELMRELRDSGLSGPIASRAISATLKATEANQNLLDICDEIKKAGKADVAGRLWAEHVASLFACVPREHRKGFVDIVLKLAEGMEKADSTTKR